MALALAKTAKRTAPRQAVAPGRVGQDLTAARWSSAAVTAAPARVRPAGRRSAPPRPVPALRPLRRPHPLEPIGARNPLSARLALLRHPGAGDLPLLLIVAALLLLGLVMVYSASQLAVVGDPGAWFRRQLIWAFLGCVALALTARVEYTVWRRLAWPAMGLTLALLGLVLLLGRSAYGAQRWLRLGPLSFQPSEIAKLALTIFIAEWLVRKGDAVRSVRYGLLPFWAITGVILALILLQNDMGTTLVVAALALALFLGAGANPLQLVPVVLAGGGFVWLVAAGTAFRRARLDAFLHPLPANCADASSYQVCQGLISLGSGGLFGRGLGDGVAKAGYLPNPFTDSIFAVIGEELGLLGCGLILALFAALAFRGLRIGRRAPDPYGALLACGITCWLVAQAAVNIGSVVDAIPFTGVPLPFVSFGGSSLVTSLAAVGVLLNISCHACKPKEISG
jgi:cell division protein FtsW